MDDANHVRAKRLFEDCEPPFRTCEAVLAEACLLLGSVNPRGPTKVVALGAQGLYQVAFRADAHWKYLETLLAKYADQPMSFAEACLVRCAETHQESRIATFDAAFAVYRWGRTRKFQIL